MDGSAGGHDFLDGRCACGTRLADLRGVSENDVYKTLGIAHIGTPTMEEIRQINALIAKMDAQMAVVLGWNIKESK